MPGKCGLTQEQLDAKGWVDANQCCTAKYSPTATGAKQVCGDLYTDHAAGGGGAVASVGGYDTAQLLAILAERDAKLVTKLAERDAERDAKLYTKLAERYANFSDKIAKLAESDAKLSDKNRQTRRETQTAEYTFSGCEDTSFSKLSLSLKIDGKLSATPTDVASVRAYSQDTKVDPFKWEDGKSDVKHMDSAQKFVSDVFQSANLGFNIVQAWRYQSLLLFGQRTTFSGTTDLAAIRTGVADSDSNIRTEMRLLLELKPKATSLSQYSTQAQVQVIGANLNAPGNVSPVVLLTDLNNCNVLYWIGCAPATGTAAGGSEEVLKIFEWSVTLSEAVTICCAILRVESGGDAPLPLRDLAILRRAKIAQNIAANAINLPAFDEESESDGDSESRGKRLKPDISPASSPPAAAGANSTTSAISGGGGGGGGGSTAGSKKSAGGHSNSRSVISFEWRKPGASNGLIDEWDEEEREYYLTRFKRMFMRHAINSLLNSYPESEQQIMSTPTTNAYLDHLSGQRAELVKSHVGVRSPPSPVEYSALSRSISEGFQVNKALPTSLLFNFNAAAAAANTTATAATATATATATITTTAVDDHKSAGLNHPTLATTKSAPNASTGSGAGSAATSDSSSGLLAPPPTRQVSEVGPLPSGEPAPVRSKSPCFAFGGPGSLDHASDAGSLTTEQARDLKQRLMLMAAETAAAHGHSHSHASGAHSHSHPTPTHSSAAVVLAQQRAAAASASGAPAPTAAAPSSAAALANQLRESKRGSFTKTASASAGTGQPLAPRLNTSGTGSGGTATAAFSPANGSSYPTNVQTTASGTPYPVSRSKFSATDVAPYRRIRITEIDSNDAELKQTCADLNKAMLLRRKYVWTPRRDETIHDIKISPVFAAPAPDPAILALAPSPYRFQMIDGVMRVYPKSTAATPSASPPSATSKLAAPLVTPTAANVAAATKPDEKSAPTPEPVDDSLFTAPSATEFQRDLNFIMSVALSGPAKTLAHNRLHILEARFNLHGLLNHEIEGKAQRVPHRDFYNVRKIDNHVHHSACMNQKHLLRFIKHKLKTNPDEPVIVRNEKLLTLDQVFESLNLRAYDLSIDTLDMHADKTFHRFDKFNLKYNPVGESRLREIFLKYDNMLKGRYLAEITRQVFDDLEANKYQFAEYRVSIYGRSLGEWDALAAWVVDHKLFSPNVRWMIQIPRLYAVYKANKIINNLQDMLENIFKPLFEVSIDPNSHPKLHQFLQQCVGFDSVDDESIRDPSLKKYPKPAEWVADFNPPYSMFGYFLYANLLVLNKLRQSKGFSTFAYRPHAGEAGDIEHLACCYLVANSINHGLMLKESPVLQYLYYLQQIGISMSPLSNNLLFVEYDRNPFPRYFARGLNVALSTDDPLMIHVTKEPLVEEYSVAAQVWKLTPIDMCEIARNSVIQCGFEHRFKAHWIGANYTSRTISGNDINQTNVPNIRIEFRLDLLAEELAFIGQNAGTAVGFSLIDPI